MRFKAGLIEDPGYYQAKTNYAIVSMVTTGILLILLFFLMEPPLWLGIPLATIYLAGSWYGRRQFRKMKRASENRSIEIEPHVVRILENDNAIESYKIKDIDRIVVPGEYRIPEEKLDNTFAELKGKHHSFFIELYKNGTHRRLEFIPESHYSLVQLNKIVQQWEREGKVVESRQSTVGSLQ